MRKIDKFETTLKVRGRVPRKLKKKLKKNKYFDSFGYMWIRDIKWRPVEKALREFWGEYHPKYELL